MPNQTKRYVFSKGKCVLFLYFRYLNMSLTEDSGVRKADGRKVISKIASNPIGRDMAFDFVRDKWSTVID